ncbi:hypothetical protein SNE40_002992 [Patella caerulea]|uniref:Secreted protein n=1 Tax=Patella caerulea TaxID=87958 RepID=A0AAN8K230_PATCE
MRTKCQKNKVNFWICLHNIFTFANCIFAGKPNDDENVFVDVDDNCDSDNATETQICGRGCRVRTHGWGIRVQIRVVAKQTSHLNPIQVTVPPRGHGHKPDQWYLDRNQQR